MFDDVVAVARCAPLTVGWLGVLRFLLFEVETIVDAFDRCVMPLVRRTVAGPRRHQEVGRILLGTSVKVSLAMSGYARAAQVPPRADLAVLGSSFTRVYDDLFDNFHSPGLDDRLTDLFAGRSFEPRSDMEALLSELYREIEVALNRTRSDPIYTALTELHHFQRQSRRQHDPSTTADELRRITRGKGGFGTIALFALLRAEMAVDEQDLIMELGDILQLLDDVHDLALDRSSGVTTEATAGHVTVSELSGRIRRLHRTFSSRYPGNSRRLFGMLYMMLVRGLFHARADSRDVRPDRSSPPPASQVDEPTGESSRRAYRLLFCTAGNLRPVRQPPRNDNDPPSM